MCFLTQKQTHAYPIKVYHVTSFLGAFKPENLSQEMIKGSGH